MRSADFVTLGLWVDWKVSPFQVSIRKEIIPFNSRVDWG